MVSNNSKQKNKKESKDLKNKFKSKITKKTRNKSKSKSKVTKTKTKSKSKNKLVKNKRIKIPKNQVIDLKKSKIKLTTLQNLKYENKSDVINPDKVKTEKDFINFLRKLYKEKIKDDNDKKEKYSSGKYGWENQTISTFLEAMLAGYSTIKNNEFDNVWTKIANIVYLGKIYE